MTHLSDSEKRRYARQIILPGMGEAAQLRLKSAKILVIGAGGLGSPALLYLSAAGVGTLGIVDHDRVELSNLQRQILFETADADRPKAESAADALADLNPQVTVLPHVVKLDATNASQLIGAYDLVLDGSDNIATRFTVHDTCYALKKPLISAAVLAFEGQISTYRAYLGGHNPCYRCLYPEPPPADAMPTCAQNGILGPVAGVMGALMAAEAVKEITGVGEGLSGILLRVDLLKNQLTRTVLKPDPACPLCRGGRHA